jgi:hypothetical protein
MNKIVIAVDLGHLKAYGITTTVTGDKIDLIESYDSVEAHGKLSEKFTDADGKFGQGGGKNGAITGNGESHNTKLEIEKRAIRLLARDISALITKQKCSKWYLAASKQINSQILENLPPAVKACLDKNITSDLTKIPKSEILKHFE